MDLIQLQELKNVAPLSKLVGVVLLSGFILPFISHIFVDYFALIVGKTFPFGWNVVTSAVVDTSVISVRLLLVDAPAYCLYLARYGSD